MADTERTNSDNEGENFNPYDNISNQCRDPRPIMFKNRVPYQGDIPQDDLEDPRSFLSSGLFYGDGSFNPKEIITQIVVLQVSHNDNEK